jgi:hypothetical protein
MVLSLRGGRKSGTNGDDSEEERRSIALNETDTPVRSGNTTLAALFTRRREDFWGTNYRRERAFAVSCCIDSS